MGTFFIYLRYYHERKKSKEIVEKIKDDECFFAKSNIKNKNFLLNFWIFLKEFSRKNIVFIKGFLKDFNPLLKDFSCTFGGFLKDFTSEFAG